MLLISSLLLGGCGSVDTKQTPVSQSENQNSQSENQNSQTEIDESFSPFQEIQEVHDDDTITIGTFEGVDINYYNFKMPKAGNIVTDSVDTSLYLYDMDLNPISSSSYHRSINGNLALEKGNYIIKANHYKNGSSFTLNSNVFN